MSLLRNNDRFSSNEDFITNKVDERKVQMTLGEHSAKKCFRLWCEKTKILKSCGADFSIIILTKWCWFKLFNVDTLNNLKTFGVFKYNYQCTECIFINLLKSSSLTYRLSTLRFHLRVYTFNVTIYL